HGVDEARGRRRRLLRHAADPGARRQRDRARFEREFAPDQPEERGLAGAVAADEADLVAVGNRGRSALEQRAPLDRIGDVGDPQHGAAPYQTAAAGGSVRRAAPPSCRKYLGVRGAPPAGRHPPAPPFQPPRPVLAGARSEIPPGRARAPAAAKAPDMATERTLSIIKPDATRRNLTGKINAKFEEAGLRIVAQKRIHLSLAQAGKFYEVHEEHPFYGELCEFMASAPVVVQVLEGEDAIAKNREVMGATNPANAAPGTIRKEFALSVGET